jgi:hypothetical protein
MPAEEESPCARESGPRQDDGPQASEPGSLECQSSAGIHDGATPADGACSEIFITAKFNPELIPALPAFDTGTSETFEI